MTRLNITLKNMNDYDFYVAGNQDPEPRKEWADGKRTDKDKIVDGHKLYPVKVLIRKNGEPIEGVSLTLRTKPSRTLKDFDKLQLKGDVSVTVWGSSKVGSRFTELHYGIEADGIEEAAK